MRRQRRTGRTGLRGSLSAMRSEPAAFLGVWALVLAVTAASCAAVVTTESASARQGLTALFVVAVAVVCEEAMSWASRLRLRLADVVHQDVLSVWAIAAALAFPASLAAAVVVTLALWSWFRHNRSEGQLVHRAVFNGANAVLTCLVASWVFHRIVPSDGGHHMLLTALVAVPLALMTYTVVNRGVAALALAALGRPLRTALLTVDENLNELTTSCLGALLALAVVYQPPLALLALPPLIAIQRAAALRELETAATTDTKTGLLNAVAWEQIASRELSRAADTGASVAVVIVDLDHFKCVNDRFGHLAGDDVLRLVGRTLAACVREYDTVARFGGEEFVAVLPGATDAAALAVAERMRARIHELGVSDAVPAVGTDDDVRLAASIGVATSDPAAGPQEVQALLLAADAALYRAKDLGRNQVVLAGGPGAGGARPVPTA